MIEAPSAARFCALIGRSGLKGYWSGSAFRTHPKGIFRERMLFANHWNVNNYCSVEVATDPDARLVLGCNDPAAYGDPWPRMSSGDLVTVYRNGKWVADGPWCEKIVCILDDVEREISALKEAEKEAAERRRQEARNAAVARLDAARAALTCGRAPLPQPFNVRVR